MNNTNTTGHLPDAHARWSWGWGWLLVGFVALLFLGLAAWGCYRDAFGFAGPGAGYNLPLAVLVYGLGYALLLPAYVWLISRRPLGALWLVVPLLAGSLALLRGYTASGMVAREAAWDQVRYWSDRPAADGPYGLLASIGATALVVASGIALRLRLRRAQNSNH